MTYEQWKRSADVLVATLLLVATFPLWALTVLLLWVFQGRPVFYCQQRVGRHGHPFTLYKFRTMVDGTPQRFSDRPVAKLPRDPRITPLGQFLRRFAIDEIPQLLNILRGEMSLVGPRPLPQDDLEQGGWLHCVTLQERARRLEWAQRRQQVLPGLTGRWQVTAQPEDDFDNWIVSDLAYLEEQSGWNDLLIVLQTPLAILRGRRNRANTRSSANATSRQSRENSL